MNDQRLIRSEHRTNFNLGKSGRIAWVIATVFVAVALLTLAILVRENPRSDLDVEVLNSITDWADRGFLDDWYDILADLTGFRAAIAAMIVSVIVAPLVTKPDNVVAYLLTLTAFGVAYALANLAINEFVGVTRPDPSSDTLSFPSGHIAGVVTAGALMVYILLKRRAHPLLIATVTIVSLFILYSVAMARLVQEAHWPSDILGGVFMGVLGLLVFVPIYHRLERVRWMSPPKVGIDVPAPQSSDAIIAGSYGSAVVLEPSLGTATKYFDPPVMLRVLYWISFQKAFPYVRNESAIEAAIHRRRIAGLITRYRFGENLVAQITRIDWNRGKAALVTEYSQGKEPDSNVEAWDYLSAVEVLFEEAGLPGWQLNPHNPHAHTNLVARPDGKMVIIDMESGFVTPFPSRGLMRSSLKHGTLPVFDDIDFDRLRQFTADREADLRRTLGEPGYAELLDSIEKGEAAYVRWHKGEPRIWSRIVRGVYRALNIRADFSVARKRMAGAQHRAVSFLEQGIARWESQQRISHERADEMRKSLADPSVAIALEHLGAHMMISVVFRFPFGSITRVLWVLTFMIRASDATIRRRENSSGGLDVHNPLVLIWAGLPGVGLIAYMFSRPLLKPALIRLALDQTMYSMPLRLYWRTGTSRWLPPRAVVLKP